MTILHLVSHSHDANALALNLKRLTQESDQLLFIGEAVEILLCEQAYNLLNESDNALFALKADLKCRGIHHLLPANVSSIDDEQMVNLTLSATQVISW